jgi:hypothetical protein
MQRKLSADAASRFSMYTHAAAPIRESRLRLYTGIELYKPRGVSSPDCIDPQKQEAQHG